LDTKLAQIEREQFCRRLADSLTAVGCPLSGTALARQFNPRADGAAVSVHGARKWLTGASFPTQERLHVLARWLNVSPQWLRYGDGPPQREAAANDPTRLPLDEVLMLNDIRALDERSREVVRDLIASLLRHHSLRS
jgi:hypothetical protein